MAYNLRSRTFRQEMVDNDCYDGVAERMSDAEVDDGSGSEYSESESSSSSVSAMELEDAAADQHILGSRARGRPTTKLKGKNGFSWDTRVPQRTSGTCKQCYQSTKHGRLRLRKTFELYTYTQYTYIFTVIFTSVRVSDIQPELIPGPAGEALLAESIDQFWDLLFDEKIIEIIVQHTNDKIEDVFLRNNFFLLFSMSVYYLFGKALF